MPAQDQKLAEVCVRRDEDPVLGSRRGHHPTVLGTEQVPVSDMDGVVAGIAEEIGDARRQGFVDQEPHGVERNGSSRSSTASAA